MPSIKFLLTNLNCGACVKVSQVKISKIPGVKNVNLAQRGSEADGVVEAEREVALAEIQQALSGTPYEIRAML